MRVRMRRMKLKLSAAWVSADFLSPAILHKLFYPLSTLEVSKPHIAKFAIRVYMQNLQLKFICKSLALATSIGPELVIPSERFNLNR